MDSGPMRPTDSSSVTVGILVAFLCLLCVGIIACIKRKTLLRLFFSNKKNTIEKLRSVGPNRLNSPAHTHTGTQTHSMYRTSPQRQTTALPQSASIYKPQSPLQTVGSVVPSHGLRRLPQCPPVHLSHPLPLTPPHKHTHTHSSPPRAPAPALACQNVCKIAMAFEKPSPPQKPLPAVPLGRNIRVMRNPSAVRLPAPIPTPARPRPAPPHPQPCRPPPKQPPTLPKPQFPAGVKFSS